MQQNRKQLIGLMIGLAAVLILFIVLISHQQSLSATINITAVPGSSEITINGNAAKQGINKVQPGAKKVIVSFNGFAAQTQSFSIGAGGSKTINVVLSSNSPATANWYLTHPKDEQTAEGISSRSNDALAQQSLKNAPLIKLLPFVSGGLEFRVDYGSQPGASANKPTIYITAPTPEGQQAGLAWIKSIGYDPSNYDIQYVTAAVQPLNS